MLTRFILDAESNQRSKIALIDTNTYRLAALIEESHVFTDILYVEEAKEVLRTLFYLPYNEYVITGNFVRFIIDNSVDVEQIYFDTDIVKPSTVFTIEGQYERELDDLNQHRKNVLKYIGYNATSQIVKKIDPALINWYLKRKVIRKL